MKGRSLSPENIPVIGVSPAIWDYYQAKATEFREQPYRNIVTARMYCNPKLKGEDFTLGASDV
jgi:hypothetical protein